MRGGRARLSHVHLRSHGQVLSRQDTSGTLIGSLQSPSLPGYLPLNFFYTYQTIEAARTIDASFATTIAGIPSSVVSKNFGIPAEKLRAAVEEESKFYLAEFQKRIAFDPNDLSNQYSLDFNSYLTYLAVGKLLQDDGVSDCNTIV
eukprot:3870433-Rhodomonas_salina.1